MCVQKCAMIYGSEAECAQAAQLLCCLPVFSDWRIRCVSAWHMLQQELEQLAPELLIVLTDGAAGMEGVYLARHVRPALPVFWFSNDYGFGMQSHRLECEYFATKPLTDDKLRKALSHCEKLGLKL